MRLKPRVEMFAHPAVWFHLLALLHPLVGASMDSCYDAEGAPGRCMPRFENVAFNRSVEASNVCGSPPEEYCMQTASDRSCHTCDSSDPNLSHGAALLTDFHRNDESTWWQSQSMHFAVQYPNSVNLTLRLGKAFEISYVRLKFYTSRPESFAIYKRTEVDGPWLPYQFYSASCRDTYGKDEKGFLRQGDDERTALCTGEFSDISPLTGGNVAFSTLEGRPSAYNFDQSLVLQEWVTATDLLISLDRLNTFGDEVFKDAQVLRSYFYGISDFSVGGRCKCNGHASECAQAEHGGGGLVCACQHHTAGDDCQRCQDFYQDRPWARATGDAANECLRCDCSGRSDRCVLDMEQFRRTGSGGRCLDCGGNTDGAHCERCRENHYRKSPGEDCLPCDCDRDGSASLQCDGEGRCACAGGVTGDQCDTCQDGFHSLGPGGCRPCRCAPAGSVGVCSPLDGRCGCKANVEGGSCGRCKPGFFNLQEINPAGCQPCFCWGHSLACSSSHRFVAVNITSDFTEDQDGWLGQFSGGRHSPLLWKEGEVYLLPLSEDDLGVYRAPDKFLGGQVHSYGQLLSITFTSETRGLLPDRLTLLLEGAGIALDADLSPGTAHEGSRPPRSSFVVRLDESEASFKPKLSAFEFQRLLFNVTALHISNAGGPDYTPQLAEVRLTSASPATDAATGSPAPWVESCSCPIGFGGQFCERCGPDFTRESPGAGPFSACVPCNCHQHGTCHLETGVCECSDFTAGTNCERCLDGYYGNALAGTLGDCRPCPCPDRSSCVLVPGTTQVVCTDCPAGQTGTRCQMCDDGFYGDPLGQSGAVRPCGPCDCSGNVDANAVGVCDHLTGRCLKCTGHTEGERCQLCRHGYYGDARSDAAGPKCKPCSCSLAGTSSRANQCHPQTGTCDCLAHVTGRDCSQCEDGFFNLRPGVGCERCTCNPVGSFAAACHPITGQCLCRAGVDGRPCGSCRVGFFGFSSRGCRACNCDPMGAAAMQCHANGTCPCRPGFTGYKCDKCELNFFHNRETHQCEECPLCYGLVQKQAEKLRARVQDLEKLLARFDCRGRYGKQRHPARYRTDGPQGDRGLPNALEEFLAFQEAREAFIERFSSLGASTGALVAQLRRLTGALNCGEGRAESGGACGTLAALASVVGASRKHLEQATLDLDAMVFPFEAAPGPNKWNMMVNESQVLKESHGESAGRIEAVAGRALAASKRTYNLLMDLLRDNSTEDYIGELTQRITLMQQQRDNMTARASQTAAQHASLQEDAAGLDLALKNITSSFPQLETRLAGPSVDAHSTQSLLQKTQELDQHLQSQDAVISKIRSDTRPLVESFHEKKESLDDVAELQARAQGAKVLALTSVVAGKEVESEAISLHRDLNNMVREWPHRQAQTKAAMKKERPLKDKVLAVVTKRISEIETILEPALENSSLARNASGEAELTANIVAQESKGVLTQAKHTRTACAHLGSNLQSAVQRLAEQEALTESADSLVPTETAPSLAGVREDMEAARRQLEAYSLTLTELIGKIDGGVPLERFDRILNETARRLSALRGSVESPALGAKIHKLRSAAREQRSRLSLLDQDVQEMLEERDSLRDISLNLPRSCPQAGGAGRG
ncbi:laminin subunit gamma-3 [Entelurus aequoreus]|uniref:laminin subunit gamma-3 n=1 Tax=Entelurus aequoreus TaxID=161455 RepID=UPI002B1E6922|nr:laminin subunit gamma-3 [Entelurus aequoreus]XP_061913005.1 laminin subunit gamma-3 [Entelurus aequoreus]